MIVYLHGFASGPGSKKARLFGERCRARGVPFVAPDLAAGDFFHLTISGQLDVAMRAAGDRPVRVMGSSLGGYLAALWAARAPGQVERAVLLAPAFDFAARWRARLGEISFDQWQRTGSLPVFHYGAGGESAVAFDLYTDALAHAAFPAAPVPTLVFHGLRDDVVPPDLSREFAARNPGAPVSLRLLDSDHELLDVTDTIWTETCIFFDL